MLAQIITENGVKKLKPLTADAGAGAPVGFIAPFYKKGNYSGWLYLDGSTFDETQYPLLYAYLGTNVLPDLRELGLKGAEKNTTYIFDSTETNPSTGQAGTQNHDVFTQGEFKDDQLQNHNHSLSMIYGSGQSTNPVYGYGSSNTNQYTNNVNNARAGTVTRGKSFGVFYYIKATSGLTEGQQDNVANIINGERSYSTSEINTGKKWIDGKPIYRKVVEINFSPNVTYTETVSANAGNSTYQVVNLSESVVVGSFGTRQPWYDSKSGNVPTTVYMSGGIVYFVTEHQAGKAYIVCEYTKTI